jgi:hypothetical protein
MNETQQKYVEAVRDGLKDCAQVCQDLSDLDAVAYRNSGFREMLFAIDGTNRFHGAGWEDVFVRQLIQHSDWVEAGRLLPRAYTEVAEHQAQYGFGEYGVGLVIDMYEEIANKPVNAASFTRRTIREFFNGVQPLEERTLFLLKRFFAVRKEINDDDMRLLFHVREETKGLRNVAEFDHFYSSLIDGWLAEADEGGQKQRQRLVFWHLECADEVTPAEQRLIRTLKDKRVSVPDTLLQHIDLSRDQLMGIA